MIENNQLNKLEKAVIKQFLEFKKIQIENYDTVLLNIKVKYREFSGVGFLTELERSGYLKVGDSDESYKWSNLEGKLNTNVDIGLLLYIENGVLDAIEGYTYSENWPESIDSVDIHMT